MAGVTGDLGPTQVGHEVLAPDSFLARCDTNGNVLWAKQLMAYGIQQSLLEIDALRNIGQDEVGYGKATMFSELDTISVDGLQFSGGYGNAVALAGSDPQRAHGGGVRRPVWEVFEGLACPFFPACPAQ